MTPSTFLNCLGFLCASIALAGLVQMLAGLIAVRQAKLFEPVLSRHLPAITLLKPLCGDEPLLEEALASFCRQDYPEFQIVFGLQNHDDPAQKVVRRLQARFPLLDIVLVVNTALHGGNRKIGNLINMLPYAKHDLLVMSDSDIHVAPDYLQRVAVAMDKPNVGLVTSLYSGLPADRGLAARLGAAQINMAFVPGVLMARWMGRDACLGATMALRRHTLARLGGLQSFRHIVADDAFLGQAVAGLGLKVQLMTGLPATTVPEDSLQSLLHHELRWARTTRSLAPVQYGLSIVQYPLAWMLLAVCLMGASVASMKLFFLVWLTRGLIALLLDHSLRLGFRTPVLWLPLRDMISALVIVFSYGSDTVRWRGQVLSVSQTELLPGEG